MFKVNNQIYTKELEIAKHAAREAGQVQLNLFSEKNHIIRKSSRELVSRTDIESQKVIESIFKKEFPDFKVFTEEKRVQEDYPTDGLFWIIDPLDGTHNYVAGLPFYGVSIALADSNNFYVGVIYLPAFDLLLWAVKDSGAYCNDRKLEVSKNNDLSKSMIAYDNQFYLASKSFENYCKIVEKSFTTRIIGSAVYDIYLIASGRIDGRIWNNTKICDIAAGITLIHEAGGNITDFQERPLGMSVHDAIASNRKVHDKIVAVLNSD